MHAWLSGHPWDLRMLSPGHPESCYFSMLPISLFVPNNDSNILEDVFSHLWIENSVHNELLDRTCPVQKASPHPPRLPHGKLLHKGPLGVTSTDTNMFLAKQRSMWCPATYGTATTRLTLPRISPFAKNNTLPKLRFLILGKVISQLKGEA